MAPARHRRTARCGTPARAPVSKSRLPLYRRGRAVTRPLPTATCTIFPPWRPAQTPTPPQAPATAWPSSSPASTTGTTCSRRSARSRGRRHTNWSSSTTDPRIPPRWRSWPAWRPRAPTCTRRPTPGWAPPGWPASGLRRAPVLHFLDSDDLAAAGDAHGPGRRARAALGRLGRLGQLPHVRCPRLLLPEAPELDPWRITFLDEIPGTCMVRRHAIEDVGGWDDLGYEDWDFWMKMAGTGTRRRGGRRDDAPVPRARLPAPAGVHPDQPRPALPPAPRGGAREACSRRDWAGANRAQFTQAPRAPGSWRPSNALPLSEQDASARPGAWRATNVQTRVCSDCYRSPLRHGWRSFLRALRPGGKQPPRGAHPMRFLRRRRSREVRRARPHAWPSTQTSATASHGDSVTAELPFSLFVGQLTHEFDSVVALGRLRPGNVALSR